MTATRSKRLPGVGRKTANVVMNVAFGAADHGRRHARIPCLEPHRAVERQNTARGRGGPPRIVPPEYGVHAHHWLILHGRYICMARKPECPTCLISDLCPFEGKTLA